MFCQISYFIYWFRIIISVADEISGPLIFSSVVFEKSFEVSSEGFPAILCISDGADPVCSSSHSVVVPLLEFFGVASQEIFLFLDHEELSPVQQPQPTPRFGHAALDEAQ